MGLKQVGSAAGALSPTVRIENNVVEDVKKKTDDKKEEDKL